MIESHEGWIEPRENERKTHYYSHKHGDIFISICGEIISNHDLNFDYKEKDSVNNHCKNCLNKHKRLLNGEQVTTSSKSIIFY